jgi:creatinine amidohydrolase
MKRATGLFTALILLAATLPAFAQAASPRVQWEELTAADFIAGLQRSRGVCVLPFGILEKHGPHLPLGTDLINVRKASLDAAAQEYAIVFPEYYFGQIFEAKHQPGTVAYSLDLQLKLLQETTDEMARNGCKKIMIVNGHGGNEHLLPLFGQAQMATEHDYVVYVYGLPDTTGPQRPKTRDQNDMHAGESETSATMISRPDLVQLDKAGAESGADQKRQSALPERLYTGIWWYARFPNHYSGNGTTANKELGAYEMKAWTDQLVTALRAIKKDDTSVKLQKEFYDRAKDPLKTKQ